MNVEYDIDTSTKVANFVVFPVGTTNIFPLANSHAGGQLLSEYNLRSRDTVTTKSNIKYAVGPSFVHGRTEFHVKTGSSLATSSTVLEITPGRAVVNGHYVESFTDIFIDLAQLNSELIANGQTPYTGKLAVGLRAMYSTEATMSGSMLVEKTNDDDGVDYYLGIQVILGPQDKMKTPEEAGESIGDMTYHLKLATFSFYNGSIRNLVNVEEKYQWLEAERIAHVDEFLGRDYISKKGLDPHKLYMYATKVDANSKQTYDTWCDGTRSAFIFDKSPEISTDIPSDTSEFGYDSSTGDTFLRLAHMQVDGMKNGNGDLVYFDDKILKLPKADYGTNKGGTVDKNYTRNIKRLSQRLSNYYHLVGGKQVYYMDTYTSEFAGLPKINSTWNVGDYTLVAHDYTQANGTEGSQVPSTFYAILPGYVKSVKYYAVGREDVPTIPSSLTGIELAEVSVEEDPLERVDIEGQTLMQLATQFAPLVDGVPVHVTYVEKGAGGDPDETHEWDLDSSVVDYSTGVIDIDSKYMDSDLSAVIDEFDNITVSYSYYKYDMNSVLSDFSVFRGTPGQDYFTVVYNYTDASNTQHYKKYFFIVETATDREWSSAIKLTHEFSLATTSTVGGFINVDDSYQDAGYVIMNDEGHLQLMDYSLLRSGVLAYQLGENITMPTGLDTEEVQVYLDDYINQRVAFPNINQIKNSENPNVIDVYLDLVEEEDTTVVNIYDIDSRFGTSIYLHITGSANSNTIINILDCEKIRIDNSIVSSVLNTEEGEGSGPVINVYRSGLYYDPAVMDYIITNRRDDDVEGFTGMQDIKLWYQRYTDNDAKIFADGMTMRRLGEAEATLVDTGNIATWDESTQKNDYHYSVALHSLTFSGSGEIVGMGILIKNNSTANVSGEFRSIIYNDLTFPNSTEFKYPEACMVNPLKITGEFVTSYAQSNSEWIAQDTKFSLFLRGYSEDDDALGVKASIAILEQSHIIPYDFSSDIAGMSIDPWSSDYPNIFYGSTMK